MSNPTIVMPDFVAREFNCANEKACPDSHNDNDVILGLTHHQVEQVHELIKPYLERGILKNLGFEGEDSMVLKASFASNDCAAFRLSHEPAPSGIIKYRLLLNSFSSYEVLHTDFSRVLLSLELFTAHAFPPKTPKLCLVAG